jgi:hypothetical protein
MRPFPGKPGASVVLPWWLVDEVEKSVQAKDRKQ